MKLDLQGVRFQKTRGIALILVLGFLVLITGLIIAFFSSVSTELTGAKSYAAGISTKQLADSAAQIVMAQISAATTGTNVAWASQPGMIRTYGDGSGGASGAELAFYKLYSSDKLVLNSTSTPSITSFKSNPSADVPTAWGTQTAVFTDLNAPVVNTSGTIYPILDPSAFASVDGAGVTDAPTNGTTNLAPMPARWLYVLKDGTITVPDAPAGAGTTATFVSAPVKPSATNPIVGRIAFWTDDETCKVNINTASEGTFWDVPRVKTTYDYQMLANNEPVQHEFQRYPGHPAMTSLSTVFPTLTPAQIFDIVPRVTGGGSNCGTQYSAGAAALTPDSDRLYASLDELMFTPKRAQNNSTYLSKSALEAAKFFLTAHSRAPETNLFNQPRIACWPIYKINADGSLDNNHTTAYDKLIAFCSTIGNLPYYFQRADPGSTSNDIGIPRNKDVYSYLQNLTSQEIPGFGGNFLQKYGSTPYGVERDQILTEIFDYIRSTNLRDDNLAAANQYTTGTRVGWVIPSHHPTNGTMGFGRMYTLSEFGIGFICNADGNDTTYGSNIATGSGSNAVLSGTALPIGQKYIQAIVVPEFFSPMMGYTWMRADMQMEIIGLDQFAISTGGTTVNLGFPVPDALHNNVSTSYNCEGSYIIAGRPFGGSPTWRMFGNGTISGTSVLSAGNIVSIGCKGSPARGNLADDNLSTSGSSTDNSVNTYPFIGKPVQIPAAGMMTFTGGMVTLNIYAGATSPRTAANLVQSINISLPSSPSFPIPNLVTAGTTDPSLTPAHGTSSTKEDWWAFSKTGAIAGKPGRLYFLWQDHGDTAAGGVGPKAGCFFRNSDGAFDVVRTVLPAHGDYRLVAARANVPASVFSKHPYYDTLAKMMASNLSEAVSCKDQGYDKRGRYINTLDYSNASFQPDIPATAATGDWAHLTPTVTGDYDTALPFNNDGPFINKPDEGNGSRSDTLNGTSTPLVPYFDQEWNEQVGGASLFSPNRQMPSPGMFGSLPTGVLAGIPWKTLLFRPQSSHPSFVDPDAYASSAAKPSDHLLMDLFWMPVVEPYAISDRFSTAGKINMNYQIVPFTYIERSTGIRALLKAERVTAIGNNLINSYKGDLTASGTNIRFTINNQETLSQFTTKFGNGDIYKSASEICDLHIVPVGETVTTMSDFDPNSPTSFWPHHALTGENLREKIYTTLYPRLTTKSNTFTVHFRVQALQKRKKDPNQAQWVEGSDVITGENRGSTIIERYIDSNDPDLPDFATKSGGNSTRFPALADRFNLDNYYKFRVVSTKQFAP